LVVDGALDGLPDATMTVQAFVLILNCKRASGDSSSSLG